MGFDRLSHLLPTLVELVSTLVELVETTPEHRAGVEHDEFPALGVDRPVAVHHRELAQLLRAHLVEQGPQAGASLFFCDLLVGHLARAAQAPSPLEGGVFVEPVDDLGELDALHDPRAPEGRRGHGRATRDVGAHGVGVVGLRNAGLGGDAAAALLGQARPGHAPLDGHDGVHEGEALEGVLGVADVALVDLVEVLLDVGAGERGPAQQHRVLRQATLVELDQVVLHDDRRLHEQPGHADHVGAGVLGGLGDVGDRLLDADVDHRVAVVAQDDVDQVLADVVHVALHRGEHDRALARGVRRLDVRFEVRDGLLHHLGAREHEGQLHLARAEQLADGLHAGQQVVVDDVERTLGRQRLVEVVTESPVVGVHDAPLESLAEWESGQLGRAGLLRRRRGHALEQLEEPRQRVVTLAAAVVDHVERDPARLVVDAVHREDLAGVHDRRGQTRLDALMQEHRVQHHACGRVQPEAHVRDAQGRRERGVRLGDATDGLDGLEGVAPRLLLARADRERQAVDDDVGLVHAPVGGEVGDEALGDTHLPIGGAGLALFVDGQGDHGGAVFLDHRHDPGVARRGAVAVFVVDRVDDRAPGQRLQAGLNDRRLGGVDHDRERHRRVEPERQLAHVDRAVASDVVGAEIEEVGALARLVLRDVDAGVPVAGEHRLAERLRPVGVRALADGQVRRVLVQRHLGIQARDGRRRPRIARGDRAPTERLGDEADVLGGGAAAAADQAQAEVGRVIAQGVPQLFGCERVASAVFGDLG